MLYKTSLVYSIILILFSLTYGDDVRWTGSGDGTHWNDPRNWSGGRVPGEEDNVDIPEGSNVYISNDYHVNVNNLTNNGEIGFGGGESSICTDGYFDNNGSITSSSADVYFGVKGNFNNDGSVNVSGKLEVDAKNISNFEGGILRGRMLAYPFAGVVLLARDQLANAGLIQGGHHAHVQGSGVHIWGKVVNNYGEINGGNGGTNQNGGGVQVSADERFNNNGSIRGGDGDGEGSGGTVNVSAGGSFIIRDGEVIGGLSGSRKTPTTTTDGNVKLVADTINLKSRVVSEESLEVYAKFLIVEIDEEYALRGGNGIYIYNTSDGEADFQRTHTENAILVGLEGLNIFSNDVDEPPESLDFICLGEVNVFPSDTTIIGALITGMSSIKTVGESDTLMFRVRNLSMNSQVLNYTVNSTGGWVTPVAGNTPILAPFESDSFEIIFTIPDSLDTITTDTINGIVTVDGFVDSSQNLITAYLAGELSVAFEYDIAPGWNILSYPFGDEISLSEAFPFVIPPGYLYDTEGLSYFAVDTVYASVGFWILSPPDTSVFVVSSTTLDSVIYYLFPGWNLIGAPTSPFPVEELEVYPELFLPPFGYDPTGHMYFMTDTLFPGLGYWILAWDTVEVVIPE